MSREKRRQDWGAYLVCGFLRVHRPLGRGLRHLQPAGKQNTANKKKGDFQQQTKRSNVQASVARRKAYSTHRTLERRHEW